ncbi:hypothetical protein SNF32_06255 [Enterococcus mundtii]|nr:hypothetical protein [Enterococcus mundtii]
MTLKITIPAQITQAERWDDLVLIVNNTTKLLREVTTTFRKDNSDVLTLIYEYVQENYHQDISLQTLSENIIFLIVIYQRSLQKSMGSILRST